MGPAPGPFPAIMGIWLCSIFKTPIFNPKFPLQSISFPQITEISAPEHHQSFCRYKEHISFKKFTVHGRFTAASPSAKRSASVQGPLQGSNWPERPEMLYFYALPLAPARETIISMLKIISRSRALHFSIRRGTYLQKIYGSSVPPPGGRVGL